MIKGPTCPYCKSASELVSATVVYGATGRGNLWMCPNWPQCDSYVGVIEGDPLARPSGTMANASLRAMRQKVHRAFEPLWKTQKRPRVARLKAYNELARRIGLSGRPLHIGCMDDAQCLKALMVLQPEVIHAGN